MTNAPVILDLCGGTGGWSIPYRNAGYHVIIVDPLADDHPDNMPVTVQEFRELLEMGVYAPTMGDVRGVFCAPPCTEFAGSGARWWAKKEEEEPWLLEESINIVLDCVWIKDFFVSRNPGSWWAMENPKGRMRRIIKERRGIDIGPFKFSFDPCDYAGWHPDSGDRYTKRTCVWGEFEIPKKRPLPITHTKGSSPIHRAPPSEDRWKFRSITPLGFANAFFHSNP